MCSGMSQRCCLSSHDLFCITCYRLPAKDMKVLAGNFEEIVQFQQMFFNIMDECAQ